MVTLLFLGSVFAFLIIIAALAGWNYWLFQWAQYIPSVKYATISSDLDGSRPVPGMTSMFTSLSGLELMWQKNIGLLSSLAVPFGFILILRKETRFTSSVLLFLWLLIGLFLFLQASKYCN